MLETIMNIAAIIFVIFVSVHTSLLNSIVTINIQEAQVHDNIFEQKMNFHEIAL